MRRKEFEKKASAGDASALRVGIALSRYNEDVTGGLLEGARRVLALWGVREKNVHMIETYGSFELPLACKKLIDERKVHAVIALGCVIKGETRHDEYIANAVLGGLMRVMLDTGVPVGLGVLTTNTLAQAKARSSGTSNHGEKAAQAALEIAAARRAR